MLQTAIQLYSLRTVDEPLPDLLERVVDARYDGVEFAYRVPDADIDVVRETLEETGLEPVAAHVSIDRLRDETDDVAEFYASLGCDRVVIPILEESYFESTEAVAETANLLEGLAADLAERDIELLYHVHGTEFADIGGETAFEALMRQTERLRIELDVGWAAVAGQDPVALLERYEGRVPLVHVADVDHESEEVVEVGEGDTDIEGCVRAARETGVEWLIYEHDQPEDPLESLAYGGEVLADFAG